MENKQSILSAVGKELDSVVANVISQSALIGFEKAHLIADATVKLQALLTPEYMAPIMALQGSSLGFKTDKDSQGGYKEEVVKKCLIEAVLWGVQPVGNQFNIIAGNTYLTKEGYGYLLKTRLPDVKQKIVPTLPRINNEKTSAAVDMNITWTKNGITETETLPIPVRMNAAMGVDAVIGKATRKARKWLYDTITGNETPDGDIEDLPHTVVGSKQNAKVDEEEFRITAMITDCETSEQLANLKKQVEPKYHDLFTAKETELNGHK